MATQQPATVQPAASLTEDIIVAQVVIPITSVIFRVDIVAVTQRIAALIMLREKMNVIQQM